MSIKGKCAVVVSSFDGFSDLWKPFFTLFFRYWPDCPFPVYLISNYKNYKDHRARTIMVGKDKGWATNIKKALQKVREPYIIYLQDDYFFQDKVNSDYLINLVDYMQKNNRIACIRLYPSPGPNENFPNNLLELGKISKNAKYRVSLQAALWEKSALSNLIAEGESGWDMEMKGSERSKKIQQPFLSVKKPAIDYIRTTAIKKGKWKPEAIELCKKEGIKLDLTRRSIDHKGKLGAIIDRLRKSFCIRKIRQIPLLGSILSRIFWLGRK